MAGPATLSAPPNGGIPNHPDLPAVIVTGAAPGTETGTGAGAAKALFRANGWGGVWEYTVFDYHHFHPDAHEALLVVAGRATLLLGGPEGTEVEAGAGDLIVLPAGYGHRLLRGADGFRVVGGYPPGQESPEILRAGDMDMDEARRAVAAVPLPESDPVAGPDGPLMRVWRG